MELNVDQFTHESWQSMIGMVVGYVGMMAFITVAIFLIPFLVVWGL